MKFALCGLLIAAVAFPQSPAPEIRFAILGDRTGETQGDVYQQVWRDVRSSKPDFVLSVGDSIQGLQDASAEKEWEAVEAIVTPAWWPRLYLAPGNHDIWSAQSEALFEKHGGHPHHYGFDHGPIHVSVLDNSRSEAFSASELEFLEKDLIAHESQPIKIVISHRPSWILNAVLRNPDFPLHRLAKRYGVNFVIAGHVHQMIRGNLEGVEYVSMPSSGGHLRASMKYEDGWFFGYGLVTVRGAEIRFDVREISGAHGSGRVTQLSDWGVAGHSHAP